MKIKEIQSNFREILTIPNFAALSFLLLTIITAGHYGFFGDELYYIACSKHLAFGYVDHPPLIALLTFISTTIFGETIIGLRFISGLFGAFTVLLSAKLAKEIGGGKYSQALAAFSICFGLAFPALSSFFSMNTVDIMLCTLFIFVFLKTIRKPSPQKWITLGILLGIGLLNKYTFLVLGFSLLLSLIFTGKWEILKSPWIYISGLIGLLIFLPHILWQINNGWPTLEFMQNATEYKNLSLSPFAFLLQLFIGLNPFTFPIWLSGLGFLFLSKEIKEYRFLGWTAFIFVLIYMLQNSKFYYVVPIFPLLLSSGAVGIELFLIRFSTGLLKWTIVTVLIVSGTLLMPLAVPILPVDQFVKYSETLGLQSELRMEKGESISLPLHFAFRFGWKELVDTVRNAYNTLSKGERKKCAILASWYGIAGALDHYGQKYNLPDAICPRNNYWIWGTHNYSGEIVLAVGYDADYLKNYFNRVKRIVHFQHPYAYGINICLCEEPKETFKQMWPKLKVFI
jgi:hypothetical protein